MEHAAEGLFDNAIETIWTRGENTEVLWASGRDIHIECSKQFKYNSYFYVSGQSRPFWAALKLL